MVRSFFVTMRVGEAQSCSLPPHPDSTYLASPYPLPIEDAGPLDRTAVLILKWKPSQWCTHRVLHSRWHPDDVNLPGDAGSLEKEPLQLKQEQMVIVKSWEELGFVEVEVRVDDRLQVPCASSFLAL